MVERSDLQLEKNSNDIVNLFKTIDITRKDISLSCQYLATRTLETDSILLVKVLGDRWSAFWLKKLYRLKILGAVLPEIVRLSSIPQTKRGLDVLEHTFRVINEVDKLTYPRSSGEAQLLFLMKIAALYHDAGKYIAYKEVSGKMIFYEHERESVVLAEQFFDKYKLVLGGPKEIVSIVVANHMAPLQYQRNPNWTDGGVMNFVRRCRGYHNLVIDFAKCDKLASSKNRAYLFTLNELSERCKRVYNG